MRKCQPVNYFVTPFNYSAGYRISGKTEWPDIRPIQYPVQPYQSFLIIYIYLHSVLFCGVASIDTVESNELICKSHSLVLDFWKAFDRRWAYTSIHIQKLVIRLCRSSITSIAVFYICVSNACFYTFCVVFWAYLVKYWKNHLNGKTSNLIRKSKT